MEQAQAVVPTPPIPRDPQLAAGEWATLAEPIQNDPVNHPAHYTMHPSGVECIQITEHMNFCLGNAVKYIWRAGEKRGE